MLGVERLDVGGHFRDPGVRELARDAASWRVAAHGAAVALVLVLGVRLVEHLPAQDGWLVGVGHARDGVLAGDDGPRVVLVGVLDARVDVEEVLVAPGELGAAAAAQDLVDVPLHAT